jgi:hypothetical protein
MKNAPLLLDSITDADANAVGRVVVSGSHGGLYPAAVASRAGIRAVIFNDAGTGLEKAGIAGVTGLDRVAMAAAAVDCMSCHIGSADDTLARGIIGFANGQARNLGIEPGQSVDEAVRRLAGAAAPVGVLEAVDEARQQVVLPGWSRPIHLVDSASLVDGRDVGRIVIAGSHGGLIGGNPDRAIKALVGVVVFNDAGTGRDSIGISRLPVLDDKGVAAVTVSCDTARIGDANSALQTGVVSAANRSAQDLGARAGARLSVWLKSLQPQWG